MNHISNLWVWFTVKSTCGGGGEGEKNNLRAEGRRQKAAPQVETTPADVSCSFFFSPREKTETWLSTTPTRK